MNKEILKRFFLIFPVLVGILAMGITLGLIFANGNQTPTAPETRFAAMTESNAGEMTEENEMTEIVDQTEAEGGEDQPIGTGPSCEFGFLVGLSSDEAVEKIQSLDRPYRVIKPFSAVTQDYRADRINLMVDDAGIVESVDCG